MTITENLVQEIVRRIVSVTQPRRIILFGSASTSQMTKDSDIDLLVVDGSDRDAREERLRIRRALHDLNHSFDVFVLNPERFEETKNVIGGVAYPAHRYGRVLYEVSGGG
jgi:predicted nucleotidyltransferase